MLARTQIAVTAYPHPLRSDRIDFTVDAGATIDDILIALVEQTRIDPVLLRHAAVIVSDTRVPKAWWSYTHPKAPVIVRALPGDDFLPILVQIAGFALAAFVPPLGTIAIGSFSIGTQFLVRGAITLATSLIAQAVAPTPRQTLSGGREAPPEARYTITGTRNQATPYGQVPIVYGRLVQYHPPLAAQPYTDDNAVGDQFIRMLFALGEGVITADTFRVGDTALAALKGVQTEYRSGTAADAAVTLYPGQVREQGLSIQLKYAAGYTYRTTEPDTDEIAIEVVFPSGMGRITDRNEKLGIVVKFKVLYTGPGISGYVPAPISATGVGQFGLYFHGNGEFSVQGYSKATMRRSVRFAVPRGQYTVGIARITVDDQSDTTGKNQSTTFEDAYLTNIRSIQYQAPLRRSGLALFAVRAQASDQLNGVIEQLNCTVQRWLQVWNGSTWTLQATRNPAWAFVDALTNGQYNARPLTYDRLDLPTILAWAQACDAQGITFDAVITQRQTVWETISDIAATGFASPTFRDGLVSVVHDTVRDVPVQHFTPRNSRGFRATKLFGDLPHAIVVRYPNEATQHQTDELKVYDDGYNVSTATKFETIDLPYTTSAAQAWRAGRRYLATARLRPEIYSFETDIEWIRCQRGDLVRVSHDVLLIGIGWGRVKARTLGGGNEVLTVTLDAAWPMEAGKTYVLRVRTLHGSGLYPVDTVAGEQSTFTFTTPVPAVLGDPAIGLGDLCIYGEAGTETAEMIVRSIEPRGDLGAALTLVDYAPAIFTADTAAIPTFDPSITLPPTVQRRAPPTPVILSVFSDESVLVQSSDGTLTSRILLAYEIRRTVETLEPVALQARWRRQDSAEPPELRVVPADSGALSLLPVDDGVTYVIELRTVAAAGAASPWAMAVHTVVGKTTPPPDVERLYRQRDLITWPYDTPPLDLAGFLVRANFGTSTSWATARALHSGTVQPPYDISELDGTQTVLVKAVDTSGNESATAASLTLALGDVLVENIILTQSEDPAFAGAITNGAVSGGTLEATSSTLFWAADNTLFWPASDAATFWPISTFLEMSYQARYAPIADHIGAVIKLMLSIVGDYLVEYRSASSPTFWPASGAATFWGADGDLFWPAEVLGPWMAWPGVLGPITATADSYDIRITVAGGLMQGEISGFDILIDVPDIEETIDSFFIAATGTVRLPIIESYRVIKNVQLTREDDGGSAVEVYYLDKNAAFGPEVRARDSAGARVSGTCDARIQGY